MIKSNSEILVVIPTYNDHTGLCESIRSIGNDEPVDILIVDDFSDEIIDIDTIRINHSGKGSLSLIRNKINLGIEESLNAGISFAAQSGYRYLGRLDAGDLTTSNRFARQLDYLSMHPEIVVLGTWVDCINQDGKLLFTLRHPSEDSDIKLALKRFNPFVHPSVVMKTSAVVGIGGYRRTYRALEDWDLFMRLSKNHKLANLPEVHLKYFIHENSISSKKRFAQNVSKVRLLTDNFAFEINSILGLTKSIFLVLTPRSWLTQIKRLYKS